MTEISPAGAPNVPAWSEDKNSPWDVSGASIHDLPLAGSYDYMVVYWRLDSANGNSSSDTIALGINNDTGNNYQIRHEDGGATNGNPPPVIGRQNNNGLEPNSVIRFHDARPSYINVAWSIDGMDGVVDTEEGAFHSTETDLTSLTFIGNNGTNLDATIRAYGMNL